MKPGTYFGEDWLDSNNYGTKDIPVRAKLTIEGDRWTVDLSDNPPQMIGPLNSTLEGATEAAVVGSLAFCVDPEIPKNDGFHRHVQILSPAGTILSAQPPFSTQEATMGAAGSTLIQFSTYIGVDHRDGRKRLWSYANFNECGGGGGPLGTDGNPCMMEMGVAGGMKFASAEMGEWLYPVGVEQCEIYEDSQGAGHWRGAPGVITRVRGDESGGPIEIYTYSWGHNNLSHGTLGGRPGIGGPSSFAIPRTPRHARSTPVSGTSTCRRAGSTSSSQAAAVAMGTRWSASPTSPEPTCAMRPCPLQAPRRTTGWSWTARAARPTATARHSLRHAEARAGGASARVSDQARALNAATAADDRR